jgi:hypothetical protein
MITDAAQSVTSVAPARFSAYDHIQTCRVIRDGANATGGSGAVEARTAAIVIGRPTW